MLNADNESAGEAKPLVVFDGDCSFCRAWIQYSKELTAESVEYEPFQQAASKFSDIPREEFARSVQMFLPTGERRTGAHAAFTVLSLGGRARFLWAYEHVPLFAPFSEAAYRTIAAHRNAAYWLTRTLWGIPVRPETYAVASELFVRLLGVIYLIAFVSFGVQSRALIGSRGIYPVAQTVEAVHHYYHGSAVYGFPSLFLINSSDWFVAAVWIAGAVFAILLMFGILRRVTCAFAFVLYLSIVTAGQTFMSFQWDALLLEAGFLAIWLSWSKMVPWMFRWLLFRLIFMSGVVKLASADKSWHALTALRYHYETQPLPTPLAWYMHQLPPWFQTISTTMVLVVELAVPLLIWFPRRVRLLAAGILIALQISILLTGNYAFFNLLSIALCVWLVDDTRFQREWDRVPRFLAAALRKTGDAPAEVSVPKIAIATGICILLLFCSFAEVTEPILHWTLPGSEQALTTLAPFDVVNSYGLFAVMTTQRLEIILEGSTDGSHWQAYEFKYKPGDVQRAPRWVEPHQPRIDWQMWFAALGNYEQNPWLLRFVLRLLQGSPDVARALSRNPFAHSPPTYVRAQVYEYHFTSWSERRATGAWWKREYRGVYLPPLDLEDFARNGME